MSLIDRKFVTSTVTLTSGLASTTFIGFGNWAGGSLIIPSGSNIDTLTYYGALRASDTFLPVYDGGVVVSQAVNAGRAVAIPQACFGLTYLKVVTDAPGQVGLALKG